MQSDGHRHALSQYGTLISLHEKIVKKIVFRQLVNIEQREEKKGENSLVLQILFVMNYESESTEFTRI